MGQIRDESRILSIIQSIGVLVLNSIQLGLSIFNDYCRRIRFNSQFRLLSFRSILPLTVLLLFLIAAFKPNLVSFLTLFGAGGRSCMFLVCNGIVGILVKDCSCSASSSNYDQSSNSNNINKDNADQSTTKQHQTDGYMEDNVIVDDHQEQQIVVLDDLYAKKVGTEVGRLVVDDRSDCLSLGTEMGGSGCSGNCDHQGQDQQGGEKDGHEDVENQDEEELEDEEEKLSAKEFNKKCEDFISMMWSELKVVTFDDSV